MPAYEELFSRNLGVLGRKEQERLRHSHVLIVGCGGIGGTVASVLARAGVGRFTLVDHDAYDASNTNRQIACFSHTLGEMKAEAVAEHVRSINPEAEVSARPELLPLERVEPLVAGADLVFPAADDFAYSIMVFRQARRLGKPALFVVPAGTWANVSMIMPDGPSVEGLHGVPRLDTYEKMRELFERRRYKLGTFYYVPVADWRPDYYRRFIERDAPPTQLCPTVWICSSMGAFEAIKVLSGKWKPVAAPRYWDITANRIRIRRAGGLSMDTFMAVQRRIFYALFQTPLAPAIEFGQNVLWKPFGWLADRVERKDREG
ncbi:MAG: ThiF family adenylyltransferase [Desulfatibacillaceae bacterium]